MVEWTKLSYNWTIKERVERASISGEHLSMAAPDIFLLKFWNKAVLIMTIFAEKKYN